MVYCVDMLNKPINWKSGFGGELKLRQGEEPFVVNGVWYLYVTDVAINDIVVYNFSTDMIESYENFQKMCFSRLD